MLFHTFQVRLHWEHLWSFQHLMFLGEVFRWIATHNHNAQIEIVCSCANLITSICKVGVGCLAKAGDRWTNTFLQPWISGAVFWRMSSLHFPTGDHCRAWAVQLGIYDYGDSEYIIAGFFLLHPTERGSSFFGIHCKVVYRVWNYRP